jgi:transposase-like protein
MNQGTKKPSLRRQEIFKLIAEREASEMTVKDFCELYDMAHGSYYYWQKKYHTSQRESKREEGKNGFTLLQVHQDQEREVIAEGLFAEYKGIRFYREPSVSFLKALIS